MQSLDSFRDVLSAERQKVTRRIQQVKKQLDRGEDSDGEKLGKKDRKRLQKKLEELRVDLNYTIVSARHSSSDRPHRVFICTALSKTQKVYITLSS